MVNLRERFFYPPLTQIDIVMHLQDKADYNTMNKYNQNFDGVYCICSRPYPDPEDEVSSRIVVLTRNILK